MRRRQIIKNIFCVLDKILVSGQIIFSRDALLSKLNKLSDLDNGTKYCIKQTIRRWEEKDLFKIKKKNGKIFYSLTPAGEKHLNCYRFKELRIHDREWDGFWRIVIFDIPESKRIGRDALRRIFRNLGFYSLQKSVFVYPFRCEKEIEFMTDFFGISDYVEILLAQFIGRKEAELKKLFGL